MASSGMENNNSIKKNNKNFRSNYPKNQVCRILEISRKSHYQSKMISNPNALTSYANCKALFNQCFPRKMIYWNLKSREKKSL